MDRASLGSTPCCCLTKHIRTVVVVGWIDEGSVAGWLPFLGLGVGVYDEEGDAPLPRPAFSSFREQTRRDRIKVKGWENGIPR